MAQSIGAMVSAGAGLYMDHVPAGYQHLFLATSVVGITSMSLLASIHTTTGQPEDKARISKDFLISPLMGMVRLLKERKDFLRFEISFMLYGTAFMMLMPVIPLYLVDDLKFSYSDIGTARGMTMQLVMIGAVPFFGRIFDRTTPHRMAMAVFAALALFPLLLLSAQYLDGTLRKVMVFVAFGWFGICMSGLTVIWSLSSIRFSHGEDSGIFQSVHVAATSARALYAPLLGYGVMQLFGRPTAILAASGVWVVASASVYFLRRYDYRSGVYKSLRVHKAKK
jgi:hypothetical protein